MSDAQRKELNAFFSFFATFDLTRPVTSAADLCDGAALYEVLALMYVHMKRSCSYKTELTFYVAVAMPTTFDSPLDPLLSHQTTGSFGLAP